MQDINIAYFSGKTALNEQESVKVALRVLKWTAPLHAQHQQRDATGETGLREVVMKSVSDPRQGAK